MEKMYKIKGCGKVSKVDACGKIANALSKSNSDCRRLLKIIQNAKDTIQGYVNEDAKLKPNKLLLRLSDKMEKEKEFQKKIIENKDFDALVKDANKSIRVSNLFFKVMTKSVEDCLENKNIEQSYQKLEAYENYLKDTIEIFDNQIKFCEDQKNEELNINQDDEIENN